MRPYLIRSSLVGATFAFWGTVALACGFRFIAVMCATIGAVVGLIALCAVAMEDLE